MYAVRTGTERNTRYGREAVVKHVDHQNVDQLTDDELKNALFYAGIGRTDEGAQRLLRRETIRRAVERQDTAEVDELIQLVVYEAVGSLFENATMHRLSGDAFNADGFGVEWSHLNWTFEDFRD